MEFLKLPNLAQSWAAAIKVFCDIHSVIFLFKQHINYFFCYGFGSRWLMLHNHNSRVMVGLHLCNVLLSYVCMEWMPSHWLALMRILGGHREASAIAAVMPTWWFVLPSVHWSVDRRLPGHSVGDTSEPLCVTRCAMCACLGTDGIERSRATLMSRLWPGIMWLVEESTMVNWRRKSTTLTLVCVVFLQPVLDRWP